MYVWEAAAMFYVVILCVTLAIALKKREKKIGFGKNKNK